MKVEFSCTVISIVLAQLLLVASQPTLAQATDAQRSCSTVASDADGDGFGWEWSREETRYTSCIVSDQSYTAPRAIDELGNDTNEYQVRAYWNANRDIAGRSITCEYFTRLGDRELRQPYVFQHDALPLISPYIAFADFPSDWHGTTHTFYTDRPGKVWTVVDGIYKGPMPIGAWVQIIDRNGQPDNAIRFSRGSADFECFDPTGRAFIPTGYVDEPLPEPQEVLLPSIPVTGPDNSEMVPDTELIIDRRTGNEVVLQPAIWDLHHDLIGREISCAGYYWSDENQRYLHRGNGDIRYVKFYPIYQPSSQENGVVTERTGDNSYTYSSDYTIDNGEIRWLKYFHSTSFSDFFSPKNIELIEGREVVLDDGQTIEIHSSIGVWMDSSTYFDCHDTGKVVGVGLVDKSAARDLIPSGVATETAGTADTDSASGDSNGENSTAGGNSATSGSSTGAGMGTGSSTGGGAFGLVYLYLVLCLVGIRRITLRA